MRYNKYLLAPFPFRKGCSLSFLGDEDTDQQVLRAIFNVVGRNCDDHIKNIAFLMNRGGEWRLSPAFDISYAWNPNGEWTSRHQMSVNGKRDGFEHEDLLALAKAADIKKAQAEQMINRIIEAVRRWPDFAGESGVDDAQVKKYRPVSAQTYDPFCETNTAFDMINNHLTRLILVPT